MNDARTARQRKRRGWIFWIGVVCAAWMFGSAAFVATSVRAFSIPTGSMAPTLKPGDRVGVDVHPSGRPKRGEVWVFSMPPWAGATGSVAVKRVIGLPGETIEVTGGKVLIDGRPLDEPYLTAPTGYSVSPITLGPDLYFMLGDSRGASHDSHVWGPLPVEYLIGPVKLRYWPLKRFGGL